ncbi:MAG TPA: hypothetical protein VN238_11215 [Solirubrobacteraceae bacterium]|nr:hypothetical protein [Solirubrobacteraceae bacterium]
MLRRNSELLIGFVAVIVWVAICAALDTTFAGCIAVAAAMSVAGFALVAATHGGDPLHFWRRDRDRA